jgi:hypothetical protein
MTDNGYATPHSTTRNWHFNSTTYKSFGANDPFDKAFAKARATRPDVIALDTPLAYAVESSTGGFYVVELDPTNGGSLEGATCSCPGGSHEVCYHRAAAWLHHTRRVVVAGMAGRPLDFTPPGPDPDQTQPAASDHEGICAGRCEMLSTCPSYRVCSQPAAVTVPTTISVTIETNTPGAPVVVISFLPPASPLPTTNGSDDPRCRLCNKPLNAKNIGDSGCCKDCRSKN